MTSHFVTEPRRTQTTAARRLRVDKISRGIIVAGGLGIIASILGILAFLLVETVPLLTGGEAGPWREIDLGTKSSILAVSSDPYQTHVAAVDEGGHVRIVEVKGGGTVATRDLLEDRNPRPAVTGATTALAGRCLAVATSDGRVLAQFIEWQESFDEATRVITPVLADPIELTLDPEGKPLRAFAVTADAEHTVCAVAQTASGTMRWVKQSFTENMMSEELEPDDPVSRSFPFDGEIAHLLLHYDRADVYAVSRDRRLLWWRLQDGAIPAPSVVPAGTEPVTAMQFLFGEDAFVLGTETGQLAVWFLSRAEGSDELRLSRARELPSMDTAVRQLAASQRNRGFLAADRDAGVAFYYATTGSLDFRSEPFSGDVTALAIAPKGDAFLAASKGLVRLAAFEHPHPEASPAAYFGKVWYERYEEPAFTWQSTGESDDFEKKLSLIPLVYGTLKGTIFAMLISVPLAVLGAMFVSQFLHASLRNWIKPAIEIMAAMPSVILGFVAALWLAPLLEVGFCAFVLMPVVFPLMIVGTGWVWMKLPLAFRGRFPPARAIAPATQETLPARCGECSRRASIRSLRGTGSEVILLVGVLVIGFGICILLNRPVESVLFGGDFPEFVRQTLKLDYEQKNSVVIAIAMSFAVIPIIFTISEDAFSNVPRNLVAGSLALGANRWQTVTRVVLPTASPGIFSATMIGFGRAIGETMIVLMATGNTPIMDWNPFNGFRTLSACIAVEIPEAPHGETLYRTLFLAALLLFALTFAINTLAEVIRQRLRVRYASL